MELVSEIQRKSFKDRPKNKGKPMEGGCLGWLRMAIMGGIRFEGPDMLVLRQGRFGGSLLEHCSFMILRRGQFRVWISIVPRR